MAELALRGGAPVRPQGYPAWPVHDERDVEAVAEVVRSGRWGGFPEPGPLAAEFAGRFAAYQGSRHGVVMVNGTVTMEVALKALGIGWGDEVIVPALTSSRPPRTRPRRRAAGVLRRPPRHPDHRPRPGRGGRHLPDQGHHAGAPRPPDGRHGPAHGDRAAPLGWRWWRTAPTPTASAGAAGAGRSASSSFSHQSTKLLTAGEGGSLLTDDEGLARRAHSLIDCGRAKDPEEKEFTFGANYRLGELHAALLLWPWSGPRPAGAAGRGRPALRAAGRRGRDPAAPARSPHHPLELLPLHRADRPEAFAGATTGGSARRWRPRGSAPGRATSR